ncbi:DUF6438 domain-containing protein [Parablastomonas sp. CN1-191]|uniref:DUF6438 domain-containing protein n=1 Tax=Parablastomonas sp. CN1-191 TaxID=3400908 RepID=UPI003BF79231
MKLLSLLIAIFGLAGCAAAQSPDTPIGFSDLGSYRISGPTTARVAGAQSFSTFQVGVTIDKQGKVVEAWPANPMSDTGAGPAVEAARQWTFKPFIYRDRPVMAVGTVEIQLLPPEIVPDPSRQFPTAAPQDVSITLERTACYGTCPNYRVTIDGTGAVVFETPESLFPGTDSQVHAAFNGLSVLWPGQHRDTVDPASVAALVTRFRDAQFMGLQDTYRAGVTDNPTYSLTLRVGGTTKQVIDYAGPSVGMPDSVRQLEDAVDELAQTRRWISGDAATIASLKAEHFDFRTPAAAQLVGAAIALRPASDETVGVTTLIRQAIDAGLNLEQPVPDPRGRPGENRKVGAAIALYAADIGDEALFQEMADKKQLAGIGTGELTRALAGGAGCSPAIAQALVEAGADPKGYRAKWSDGTATALHALRSRWTACATVSSARRVAFARSLIALRVPLEVRDDIGWTPLMGLNDPDVARVLLDAGADPNKTSSGLPTLMSGEDERVVLLLLDRGANPRVADGKKTLRQLARNSHWQTTTEWLDQHGVP